MKLPKFTLKHAMVANFVAAALNIVNGIHHGPSWWGMVSFALAGFALAAGFACQLQIAARQAFDEMHCAYQAMAQINSDLVARFMEHAIVESPPLDPPDEPRRLH